MFLMWLFGRLFYGENFEKYLKDKPFKGRRRKRR
tara:strand:+ start:140 stop:241 length:102 start_codon:yes stop_codon:yes gene_type:complete